MLVVTRMNPAAWDTGQVVRLRVATGYQSTATTPARDRDAGRRRGGYPLRCLGAQRRQSSTTGADGPDDRLESNYAHFDVASDGARGRADTEPAPIFTICRIYGNLSGSGRPTDSERHFGTEWF